MHRCKALLRHKAWFLLLAVALAAECFLFNYRTWESLTFSPVASLSVYDGNGQSVQTGQPITADENGEVLLLLDGINQTAHNLYLDAVSVQDPGDKLTVRLSARDEGNNQYYDLPAVTIRPEQPADQYIKLNLSGKAKSLKITVSDIAGERLELRDIELNRRRPLQFSVVRALALYLLLLGLYAVRPGSPIYKTPYSLKSSAQRVVLAGLLVAQVSVAVAITVRDPNYVEPPWAHHYQYHELAVSISEGHFYLNEEPSEELMAMENPYDTNERHARGVPYAWDTAYYNGKYYSYFGVLPVFVYYLPYYLITGQAFPTYIGILINAAALAIGVFFLLDALVRRFFPNTSMGLFILLECLLLLGCGFLVIVNSPSFYTMPKSMALTLTVWGLYCWLRAFGNRETPGAACGAAAREAAGGAEGVRLSNRWLAAGALLLALVSACRPQMLVGSFLALPLFWQPVKDSLTARPRKTREVAANLLSVAVPYIVVAALVMYYNAARFGSPFDFGANYNLTTNDMTHRGFHLDRLPFGLFTYLFQPPAFIGRYPFMTAVQVSTGYQGATIWESMYGGFLWFHLIGLVWLFWGRVKAVLREKGLGLFCLLSAVLGLVVVCADTEMAGILPQYACDFGIFLTLPAVILALGGYEKAVESPTAPVAKLGRTLWVKALIAVFLLTMAMHIFWLLATNPI